jgi:hypothetical protein
MIVDIVGMITFELHQNKKQAKSKFYFLRNKEDIIVMDGDCNMMTNEDLAHIIDTELPENGVSVISIDKRPLIDPEDELYDTLMAQLNLYSI